MRTARLTELLSLAAALAGCGRTEKPDTGPVEREKGGAPMSIAIQSRSFAAGTKIPVVHSEDGKDLSPPLTWSGVPEGTKELALIVDDPDAPVAEPWVHWVIYKIPGSATGLKEGIPRKEKLDDPKGALQGRNTWPSGNIGYRGPAPPRGHGVHHYHFKLYALDVELDLKPGLDKKTLLAAMAGHILAQGELVGTYQR